MSRYRHTKGVINDNALQAILYDPLFRQRIEQNKKGKGSYRRKSRDNRQGGEGNEKGIFHCSFSRDKKTAISVIWRLFV